MTTTHHSLRSELRPATETGSRQPSASPIPSRDRVFALASLSHRLPDRLIATQVARQLQKETGRSVLLIHLDSRTGTPINWKTITTHRLGEFSFAGQLRILDRMTGELDLEASKTGLRNGQLQSLISHCQEHFHYVLIRLDAGVSLPLLDDCLRQAGQPYVLLQPRSEDLYLRDLLLREMQGHPQGGMRRIRTVFCREKGEPHHHEWLRRTGGTLHAHLQDCPAPETPAAEAVLTRQFCEDIGRLAREMGRCRIGLALSSGGARGLAHIGVFQVLEEHGISVDIVAGCSMGAYVGSVWAFGYDGVHMEKLAREVEHRWGIFELADPFFFPRRGFMRGEKVKRRLQRSIGDVHFAELRRPLLVVATNLVTLDRKVFTQGEVAEAVHASSAIPGTCAPVRIGGDTYIDGGVCDPLPVGLLQEAGIERIIAVNTIPTPDFLHCGEDLRQEARTQGRPRSHRLSQFFHRHFNYFAPGNILDTIFRSFHGAQMRVAEQSCRQADLVLRPIALDGRWHDFTHPGKYIAIGRREAEARLDQIKALVQHGVSGHEIRTPHHAVATTA